MGLGLFGTCFLTAAQPVWLSAAASEQGDLASSQQKRDQLYRRAAAADPISAEPWEKLASSLFNKWRAAQKRDDRDIQAAIDAQQTAIRRNPLGYHGYRALGELHLARAQETGADSDKQAAVSAFKLTLQRYPNHADLNALAANAFVTAGDYESAASAALRAVQQDDINHNARHTDKFLGKEARKRVEELAVKTPLN